MQKTNGITWHLLLNPHAGGGKGAQDRKKIEALLQRSDIRYQLSLSNYPGHAIHLAKELVESGATHIIVAGGDGTLNEAVNGIFLAGGTATPHITLGMIPVGTGNDWTKTFGIPDHYRQAIDIILEHKTVLQDVGEIISVINGRTSLRYFVNIAGFGFDALVARKANILKFKGITGIRVYIQSLLSGYLRYRSRPVQIIIDGQVTEVSLFSASIGIGKFNGGGMMQVPEAHPLKGLFHITIIRKIGIWGILTNFKGLYSGKFIRDRRVSTHAGKEVLIQAGFPVPGEADGETLGNGTFRIGIIPHRLRVIYGSDKFLGTIPGAME